MNHVTGKYSVMDDLSRCLLDFSKSSMEEPLEAVCVSISFIDITQLALHAKFVGGEFISLDTLGVHCQSFQRLAIAHVSDSANYEVGSLRARTVIQDEPLVLSGLEDNYWDQTVLNTFPEATPRSCFQKNSVTTIKVTGRRFKDSEMLQKTVIEIVRQHFQADER